MATRVRSFDWKALGLLALWMLCMHLLGSYDSPLHYPTGRIDSAIFMMSGRAWALGLTPYTDFADSKGPLLWLFYAIGYFIDPKGYGGTFVLYWAVGLGAVWYCYRTALLLLGGSRRMALFAAMVMAVPMLTFYHNEMRCEDLGQLPMSYGIWCLVLALQRPATACQWRGALGMGLGVGMMLMIKWNLGLLLCVFPISIGIVALYQGHKLWRPLLAFVTGCAVMVLPFIIWFAFLGNLHDFFHEYFANTTDTFTQEHFSFAEVRSNILDGIGSFKFMPAICAAFAVKLMPGLPRWQRWLPCIIASLLCLVLMYHDNYYYTNVLAPFAIFLACWLLAVLVPQGLLSRRALALGAMLVVLLMAAVLYTHHNMLSDKRRSLGSEYVENVLSRANRPKILCYKCLYLGWGYKNDALPAGRHWFVQWGATDEMLDSMDATLRQGSADYIFTQDAADSLMVAHGYGLIQVLPLDWQVDLHNVPMRLYGRAEQ